VFVISHSTNPDTATTVSHAIEKCCVQSHSTSLKLVRHHCPRTPPRCRKRCRVPNVPDIGTRWKRVVSFRESTPAIIWIHPTPVAVRSEAWVCSHLIAGIAGTNSAEHMNVCLLCLLCVASATGLSSVQRSPTGCGCGCGCVCVCVCVGVCVCVCVCVRESEWEREREL